MYNATKEQYAAFDRQHDYLGSKLKLGQEILWLTKEQCIQCGPGIDEILDIVKDTMIAHGKTEYEMPAKIGIHPYEDVFFHAMPAYVPGQTAVGIKWIECFPRNPRQYGLPQTTGVQVMNDIATGVPVAIMDCTWITAMRTPAVTALSAAALKPDTEYFGMFGAGAERVGSMKTAGSPVAMKSRRSRLLRMYAMMPLHRHDLRSFRCWRLRSIRSRWRCHASPLFSWAYARRPSSSCRCVWVDVGITTSIRRVWGSIAIAARSIAKTPAA